MSDQDSALALLRRINRRHAYEETLESGYRSGYNDIQIPLAGQKIPSANAPTWSTFNTNFKQYTWALSDAMNLDTAELLHGWIEGGAISLHMHWASNGQEVDNHWVRWQVEYCWANSLASGGTTAFTAPASDSGLGLIPANTPTLTHMVTTMATFTPTGGLIGAYLVMKVSRIAVGGQYSEPGANPFGLALGIHYQVNSLGSFAEWSK